MTWHASPLRATLASIRTLDPKGVFVAVGPCFFMYRAQISASFFGGATNNLLGPFQPTRIASYNSY